MKMEALTDAIAIDTNVFLHLFDAHVNADNHIQVLLYRLQGYGVSILVDDGNRISGEYLHQIGQRMRNSYDQGIELQLLRYWMDPALRTPVSVDFASRLMREIRKVIVEPKEAVDRIFVHVALSQGKRLVTNDWMNIVDGPSRETKLRSRRHRMLRDTKNLRPDGGDILTSQEASVEIEHQIDDSV